MNHLYQIQNLQHHYNGHPALDIDSFAIQPGTITGIIGPNGSGKSTLLKMLAFIDKPGKGEILFKGKATEPFADRVRFQVTLLTQEPYLMKRSVFKNISYGLELRRDTHDLSNRVHDALGLVGLSGNDFLHRKWYELSGGEAQRVALAARLILKPEVLLLDEPTASIDAASAQIIRDTVLLAQNTWGTTLVIASHDWEWLYDICQHVEHLFRGRFFGTGRQNFIFGPWSEPTPGKWVKALQDGQTFEVPCPPSKDAIAIINPEKIRLDPPQQKACMIQGTLTRLVWDKHTREIIIIVQAANLAITVRLSPKNAHRHDLYPGQKVRLFYEPEHIFWY